MKSESVKSILAFMSMGLMFRNSLPPSHVEKSTPEAFRKLKEYSKIKYNEILLSRGLKEWTIDGITVVAINEKNAIRKVNNIKRESNETNNNVI